MQIYIKDEEKKLCFQINLCNVSENQEIGTGVPFFFSQFLFLKGNFTVTSHACTLASFLSAARKSFCRILSLLPHFNLRQV